MQYLWVFLNIFFYSKAVPRFMHALSRIIQKWRFANDLETSI